MKAITILALLVTLILGCDSKPPTEPQPTTTIEPKTYTLTIYFGGEGGCQVTPDKSEYNEGEIVTLHAYPDSGWGFIRWEGNLLSTDNPVLITMDSNKDIIVIFEHTFLPDITGKWGGVEFLIILDLEQRNIYDSYFEGEMRAVMISGDTLFYSVYGHNTPPTLRMDWHKAGYYQIVYNGTWINEVTMDGYMEENHIQYDLDFIKIDSTTTIEGSKKFNPKKIN
jgi:hypothetical protein